VLVKTRTRCRATLRQVAALVIIALIALFLFFSFKSAITASYTCSLNFEFNNYTSFNLNQKINECMTNLRRKNVMKN